MSFNSFSESPDYPSFYASFDKQQEEEDGFRHVLSLCPFYMEERLEKLEELSQRQEEDRRDLAKNTGAKARFPRRLRHRNGNDWQMQKKSGRSLKRRERKERQSGCLPQRSLVCGPSNGFGMRSLIAGRS
jgi:hypothetical protein